MASQPATVVKDDKVDGTQRSNFSQHTSNLTKTFVGRNMHDMRNNAARQNARDDSASCCTMSPWGRPSFLKVAGFIIFGFLIRINSQPLRSGNALHAKIVVARFMDWALPIWSVYRNLNVADIANVSFAIKSSNERKRMFPSTHWQWSWRCGI